MSNRTLQQIIESEQEPSEEEQAYAQALLDSSRKARWQKLIDEYMTTDGPRSGRLIQALQASEPYTVEMARQFHRAVQTTATHLRIAIGLAEAHLMTREQARVLLEGDLPEDFQLKRE